MICAKVSLNFAKLHIITIHRLQYVLISHCILPNSKYYAIATTTKNQQPCFQGACGTCPSSTQTMKMGLERKLKERIPEIQEVIQAMPDSPDLNEEQINVVLDSVRPFLNVAGGTINVSSIAGAGGVQPTIILKMEGAAASLNSVKLEIAQRLQRHFMIAGLKVEWA
jgi:Fe-S cluster biogenesis protein NfuA